MRLQRGGRGFDKWWRAPCRGRGGGGGGGASLDLVLGQDWGISRSFSWVVFHPLDDTTLSTELVGAGQTHASLSPTLYTHHDVWIHNLLAFRPRRGGIILQIQYQGGGGGGGGRGVREREGEGE